MTVQPTKRQQWLAERAFPNRPMRFVRDDDGIWRLLATHYGPIDEIVGDGDTPQAALYDAIRRRSQRRKQRRESGRA